MADTISDGYIIQALQMCYGKRAATKDDMREMITNLEGTYADNDLNAALKKIIVDILDIKFDYKYLNRERIGEINPINIKNCKTEFEKIKKDVHEFFSSHDTSVDKEIIQEITNIDGSVDKITELVNETIAIVGDVQKNVKVIELGKLVNKYPIEFKKRVGLGEEELTGTGDELKKICNNNKSFWFAIIQYFMYIASNVSGVDAPDGISVISENDDRVDWEDMHETFKKWYKPDPRQLLTIQRFTKFKPENDKACFLLHGVGTGKTITSLSIMLYHLQNRHKFMLNGDNNEKKPLKVLIIGPNGLFRAAFLKDCKGLGIYTNNTRVEDDGREMSDGYVNTEEYSEKNQILPPFPNPDAPSPVITRSSANNQPVYKIEFTGYDYDQLFKENGLETIKDMKYDVVICDEAHRFVMNKIKPEIEDSKMQYYSQITEVTGTEILENSKKPEPQDACIVENIPPPVTNTFRDKRFMEFISKQGYSIFLSGTPYQTSTDDMIDIAWFLNNRNINESNAKKICKELEDTGGYLNNPNRIFKRFTNEYGVTYDKWTGTWSEMFMDSLYICCEAATKPLDLTLGIDQLGDVKPPPPHVTSAFMEVYNFISKFDKERIKQYSQEITKSIKSGNVDDLNKKLDEIDRVVGVDIPPINKDFYDILISNDKSAIFINQLQQVTPGYINTFKNKISQWYSGEEKPDLDEIIQQLRSTGPVGSKIADIFSGTDGIQGIYTALKETSETKINEFLGGLDVEIQNVVDVQQQFLNEQKEFIKKQQEFIKKQQEFVDYLDAATRSGLADIRDYTQVLQDGITNLTNKVVNLTIETLDDFKTTYNDYITNAKGAVTEISRIIQTRFGSPTPRTGGMNSSRAGSVQRGRQIDEDRPRRVHNKEEEDWGRMRIKKHGAKRGVNTNIKDCINDKDPITQDDLKEIDINDLIKFQIKKNASTDEPINNCYIKDNIKKWIDRKIDTGTLLNKILDPLTNIPYGEKFIKMNYPDDYSEWQKKSKKAEKEQQQMGKEQKQMGKEQQQMGKEQLNKATTQQASTILPETKKQIQFIHKTIFNENVKMKLKKMFETLETIQFDDLELNKNDFFNVPENYNINDLILIVAKCRYVLPYVNFHDICHESLQYLDEYVKNDFMRKLYISANNLYIEMSFSKDLLIHKDNFGTFIDDKLKEIKQHNEQQVGGTPAVSYLKYIYYDILAKTGIKSRPAAGGESNVNILAGLMSTLQNLPIRSGIGVGAIGRIMASATWTTNISLLVMEAVGFAGGMWAKLSSVRSDNLIKHTAPYTSIYNYDYNEYAIDMKIFERQLNQPNNNISIKSAINCTGTKNAFPEKYVDNILVPYTQNQKNAVVNEKNISQELLNNIGCFTPDTPDTLVTEDSGKYTYVTSSKEKELINKYLYNLFSLNPDPEQPVALEQLENKAQQYKENGIYTYNNQFSGFCIAHNNEIIKTQEDIIGKVNDNIIININITNNITNNIIDNNTGNTYITKLKTDIMENLEVQDKNTGIDNPRFNHILHLLKITRCGAIMNRGKPTFQSHYVYRENETAQAGGMGIGRAFSSGLALAAASNLRFPTKLPKANNSSSMSNSLQPDGTNNSSSMSSSLQPYGTNNSSSMTESLSVNNSLQPIDMNVNDSWKSWGPPEDYWEEPPPVEWPRWAAVNAKAAATAATISAAAREDKDRIERESKLEKPKESEEQKGEEDPKVTEYKKKITLQNMQAEYYLPLVYPSTREIMFRFCEYLNKKKLKYIWMCSQTDSIDKELMDKIVKYGTNLTFPLRPYNYVSESEDPICVIISPDHTEGFSFTNNPCILLPALCKTAGDIEQVHGRALRKYSLGFNPVTLGYLSDANFGRYQKKMYQLFGGSDPSVIANYAASYGGSHENSTWDILNHEKYKSEKELKGYPVISELWLSVLQKKNGVLNSLTSFPRLKFLMESGVPSPVLAKKMEDEIEKTNYAMLYEDLQLKELYTTRNYADEYFTDSLTPENGKCKDSEFLPIDIQKMIEFNPDGNYCVTIMGHEVEPGNTHRKIFNAIICQKQETRRQLDVAEGGNLKKSRKRRGSKNKKTIKKINKKTIKKINKQAKRKIKKRTRKYRK